MKLIRLSGRPVNIADLEAYEVEFKAGFDASMRKHAQPGQESTEDVMQLKAVDMLSVQQDLQALDAELSSKYATVAEVQLPKTMKAWKQLMKQVEAPVMIAQSSENVKEFVLVIVDRPIDGSAG